METRRVLQERANPFRGEAGASVSGAADPQVPEKPLGETSVAPARYPPDPLPRPRRPGTEPPRWSSAWSSAFPTIRAPLGFVTE